MQVVVSFLPAVMAAVTDAAKMLVEESRRLDGPRGAGDKAEVDVEIEEYLADALTAIMPCRLVGEETGARPGDESDFCWLVDPHDGARTWLQGHRGSAVSVALLDAGKPVLGVVCSPMSPDRGWDLIAWAEGLPYLQRNGGEVRVDLSQRDLEAGDIVFLSHDAAATPTDSGTSVAPARFVSLPSIAYRLARVAAGDGVTAVSLNCLEGPDYVGGHALLRGVGGVLLDETGREVSYSREGASQVACCFGGAPKAARTLVAQSSGSRGSSQVSRPAVTLSWPRAVEGDVVDHAKGCLFGQVIGDNLGALVEFRKEQDIARLYPGGVVNLSDGGCWNLLAGQPTDDSELALTLARTLLETGSYNREIVAKAYAEWYARPTRSTSARPPARRSRRPQRLTQGPRPMPLRWTRTPGAKATARSCGYRPSASGHGGPRWRTALDARFPDCPTQTRYVSMPAGSMRPRSRKGFAPENPTACFGLPGTAPARRKSPLFSRLPSKDRSRKTITPIRDGSQLLSRTHFVACDEARTSKPLWWRRWERAAIGTPTPPSRAHCWARPMDFTRSRTAGLAGSCLSTPS